MRVELRLLVMMTCPPADFLSHALRCESCERMDEDGDVEFVQGTFFLFTWDFIFRVGLKL